MTSLNPQTQSRRDSNNAVARATLSTGFITDVRPNNDTLVSVQPVGQSTEIPMICPMWANGDVHVPHLDAPLKVYYMQQSGEYPVIIAFGYTDPTDVPEYETGERRISHSRSDTDIYFQKDGTVTISTDGGATIDVQADGTVQINGGTKGAIHDITTTKDGDGHVTDITLERRSDILL